MDLELIIGLGSFRQMTIEPNAQTTFDQNCCAMRRGIQAGLDSSTAEGDPRCVLR
jgi:hypothetical protein